MNKFPKGTKVHSRTKRQSDQLSILKIKFITKNLLLKKTLDQDYFTGKFYQTSKQEIKPILHKLLQKTEEEKILLNLYNEASITLIPKPNNIKRKGTLDQNPSATLIKKKVSKN